jgi:predicted TIM-barrel fold metal-dependent hydrolase
MRKLNIMRDVVGAHRILFGTDEPSLIPGDFELTKRWVQLFKNLPEGAKKYGVDFSQEETELILYGNAERIFKI